MAPRPLIWFLLILWGIAFAASAHSLVFVAPTGDGFARGLNKLEGFALWQMIASLLSVLVWWAGRRIPLGILRWVTRLPALLALALTAFVVSLIVWANFSKPAPAPQPVRPVTQPVDS